MKPDKQTTWPVLWQYPIVLPPMKVVYFLQSVSLFQEILDALSPHWALSLPTDSLQQDPWSTSRIYPLATVWLGNISLRAIAVMLRLVAQTCSSVVKVILNLTLKMLVLGPISTMYFMYMMSNCRMYFNPNVMDVATFSLLIN